MSDYTKEFKTEELLVELLKIKFNYALTGTISKEDLDFLLQCTLATDGLLRKIEADAQTIIDLEAKLFSKDIEIAELTGKLAEKEPNA